MCACVVCVVHACELQMLIAKMNKNVVDVMMCKCCGLHFDNKIILLCLSY